MSREGGDEPSQETVLLCKLIAQSQEDMLRKLHESQGDVLQKLIESQERSQHQLLETLTTNFNKGLAEVLSRQLKDRDEEERKDVAIAAKKLKTEDADNNGVLDVYEDFYDAAYEGNWKKASEFLIHNRDAVDRTITTDNETALHVAIMMNRWSFVQELVKRMTPEALEIKDKISDSTALHYAAFHGNKRAAEAIVNRNPMLTLIQDKFQRLPLQTAFGQFSDGQKETVEYLYRVTKQQDPSDPFSGVNGANLLCIAIEYNYYDLALALVKGCPELVTKPAQEARELCQLVRLEKRRQLCGLEELINRPFAFKSGAELSSWRRFIYSLIHVDISSPYVEYDIEEVYDNSRRKPEGTAGNKRNLVESSDELEGDLEDPSEISKSRKADKMETASRASSQVLLGANDEGEIETTSRVSPVLSNKEKGMTRVVKNFISTYILPYHARAHLITRLYKEKVMHIRATKLVTCMLEKLKLTVSDEQELLEFLDKTGIMNTAIEYGITEFVKDSLERFPFLIWHRLKGKTMIQMAIEQRNETILNLILDTSGNDRDDLVSTVDDDGNSILHYAAKLAPAAKLKSVSGAALQMQREVQWFKGVQAIVHRNYKYTRNVAGNTAKFLFANEHQDLVEKGEQWMKDTSGSCMVVATLIATVAFAAAITVPGGNNGDTGVPIFLRGGIFTLFAIADAVALLASITSVLMFLAIMTSRYSEEDFYRSLPQKLILGLVTLFNSMACILISAGAAFTLLLRDQFTWAPIPVAFFGVVTVFLFASLEFPLFAQLVISTYYPNIFRVKQQYVVLNNKKKTTEAKANDQAKKEL